VPVAAATTLQQMDDASASRAAFKEIFHATEAQVRAERIGSPGTRRHNKGELMWFAWKNLLGGGPSREASTVSRNTALLDTRAATAAAPSTATRGRSALIWSAFKEYMDTGTIKPFNDQAAAKP